MLESRAYRLTSEVNVGLANNRIIGLYCEEGPSTDVADLLTASMPLALTFGGLAQRTTAVMAQVDK